MVKGQNLVDYVNEKHTNDFKLCLGHGKVIDPTGEKRDLILKFGTSCTKSDLTFKTYEGYLKTVIRHPITRKEFKILERISSEVDRGVYK